MIHLSQMVSTRKGTQGIEWLERAVARVATIDNPLLNLRVQAAQADILLDSADPRAWAMIDRLPWDHPPSDDDTADTLFRTCLGMAHTLLRLGHYAQALTHHRWAARRAEAVGWETWSEICHDLVDLRLRWETGQWTGLEAAAGAVPDFGLRQFDVVRALLLQALTKLARGDAAGAEAVLCRCSARAREVGDLDGWASACGALARIQLDRGRAANACAALQDVLALHARRRWLYRATDMVSVAVEALAGSACVAEAAHLTDQLAADLLGRDVPLGAPALAICRGHVEQGRGEVRSAAREFGRASDLLRKLPRPYDAARAEERRGKCLLAIRDPRGEAALLAALAEFERLGALGDCRRLRLVLRRHSIRIPHRGRGGRYGVALSPREREVVDLAGRGRTAVEIADELALSERTVEHHLAHAMRKLGIRRKRDLVRSSAPTVAQGQAV
jgi:DNA-binding CsgD family transcriptional regulator